MAKPEWGTKRVCLNCGVRFYDMLRDPIICPSCETPFDPTANLKSRRGRSTTKAVAEAEKKEKVVNGEDEIELDLDDDDLDEALDDEGVDADVAEDKVDGDDDEESERAIEDVSELGDDDVTDVIDVDGEGDEETT